VTIKKVGTYTIDSSGVITFTPVKNYVGTPTPLKYQVKDTSGQWANSEYTPTIKPPSGPKASPQRLFVAPGKSVTFTKVIGTGGLGSGIGLKTSSQGGPCFVTVVDSVSSCVSTLKVDDEGSWRINPKTGVATFTALASLAEGKDATPVRYRITDQWGQTAESTLTPYTKRGIELPTTGNGLFRYQVMSLLLLVAGWRMLRRRSVIS
jgi:hypothetical protein